VLRYSSPGGLSFRDGRWGKFGFVEGGKVCIVVWKDPLSIVESAPFSAQITFEVQVPNDSGFDVSNHGRLKIFIASFVW